MADKNKTNILPVRHTMYVLERLDEQRRRGKCFFQILVICLCLNKLTRKSL